MSPAATWCRRTWRCWHRERPGKQCVRACAPVWQSAVHPVAFTRHPPTCRGTTPHFAARLNRAVTVKPEEVEGFHKDVRAQMDSGKFVTAFLVLSLRLDEAASADLIAADTTQLDDKLKATVRARAACGAC